jgi:hypothetical protein
VERPGHFGLLPFVSAGFSHFALAVEKGLLSCAKRERDNILSMGFGLVCYGARWAVYGFWPDIAVYGELSCFVGDIDASVFVFLFA